MLSLREECWAVRRRESLWQLRADLCHAGERQRLLDGRVCDARIAQRNLVSHAAVDDREFLLDAAAEWPPLFSGDGARVEAADADAAGPRRIEAENQLEERRLADARATGQCDGLAFAHDQGKIAKEGGPLAVAEGDVLYDEWQLLLSRRWARGGRWQTLERRGEELAQPVDASDGGLDVLDLHADAFERGEDAAHVGNQGDDTADGHAEERLHRTAAHGERHHEADDDCAAADDDGRVDGVTEIAALHGSKTALQSGTEVLCHVALLLAEMDGADVVDRLRDQGARLCDGCAIVELGLAHALLEVARQQEE